MAALISRQIVLDYADAADANEILTNLSGAEAIGDVLWTVSDEGRTIECLVRNDRGFKLLRQLRIDDLIDDLPGGDDDELDLEGLDISSGRLWLCGSHCRVRKQAKDGDATLRPDLRDRKGRQLLASFGLTNRGRSLRQARHLPFKGKGSLRKALADDPFLAPFLELPSKENGFDIEGISCIDGKVMLGLRGPLIDSHAVVVALSVTDELDIGEHRLHFLDLGGLGVRDITADGDNLLVIAGPMSGASGPFRLHRWKPGLPGRIDTPEVLFSWPAGPEKPEAICRLSPTALDYLVLYDKPNANRLREGTFLADLLSLEGA